MTVTFPEQCSPALRSLVSQLWLTGDAGGPLRIRFDEVAEPGCRLVERYLVLPNLRRAQFLVPLGPRAASVASLRAYNALRPLRTRLLRSAAGGLTGAGAAQHLCRGRLSVWLPTTVPRADERDLLLLRRLAQDINVEVFAGIGIRPDAPNSKPTLQLFAGSGRPVGYVKLGWNDSTRRQVANETAALTRLTPRLRVLSAPALLTSGEWASRRYVATAPLPGSIRRHGSDVPGTRILTDVAAAGGGITRDPADTMRFLDVLHRRVTTVAAGVPAFAAVLLRALSITSDRLRGDALPVGAWHGDWVSWNVGRDGTHLHAWDWEHSGMAAPLGFDALHWNFQEHFIRLGRPLEETFATLPERTAGQLAALGVPPAQHRTVTSLYVVEMAVRAAEMRAGGAGWNVRFYPAIHKVLLEL